jgi:hypothetical protein
MLDRKELGEQFRVDPADLHLLVDEGLALFEQEYGIPPGLLRPDDPLTLFTDFTGARHPIAAFFERTAREDSVSELNYALKKRRKLLGTLPGEPLRTLGDFVRAFLGYSRRP